jgi:DNA-binding response OmpR family regulator
MRRQAALDYHSVNPPRPLPQRMRFQSQPNKSSMPDNTTILVVDDEPAVLRVLRAVLERDGYDVLTACDVATAKQAAPGRHIALILSDIDLPDGTGLELCLWAKARPELAQAPVLLCSGRDDPETRRLALEAGAVDFVAKPFVVAELRERIRFHLRAAG